MLFLRSVRIFVIGLLAVGSAGYYGLRLSAQQGGLTPPPKPTSPKPPSTNAANVPSNGSPFVVGERLSFSVSWSNFPTAARLEMEVAERGQFFGQESYQIKTKVETIGPVRSLFGEIDNQYTSYINVNNAVPHKVVTSIRQGQRQAEETIVFDHSKQQAIFSDDSTISMATGTYDLPSLVYGLRLRALPENGRQKLAALYGKELIEIEAVVTKRERVTTQSGAYNTVCVKFYPQKNFSKYRAYIWLTDDEQKLPVMIKAKLSIGELRAELTSATVTSRPSTTLSKLNTLTDESGKSLPPGAGGTNGRYGGGEKGTPFTVGERLNYEVSWGDFVSVGRASFEVRQQGMLGKNRVYEFYGEATSTGAARTLINVNDQVSSFASVDKLIPLRTDLRLREGRRVKQVSTVYDWSRNFALLSTGTQTAIRPGTLDLVSLFYAIRATDLKIGADNNFLFLDANNRLQMVTIRTVKQETIGGPMGNRETLQLNVLAPAPSLALIAQAWISNDDRRLPLYFAARTRFGELRFQMTSAVNTK